MVKLDPAQSGTPSLIYATFLGGGQPDEGQGIAVDSNGVAWVVGYTQSFSGNGGAFPTTPNAFQHDLGFTNVASAYCHGGTEVSYCPDVFVTGLSDGTQLVYSTYIGGDGPDTAYAVAVDSAGMVYVTGQTFKYFPTTPNATQSGGYSVFGAGESGAGRLCFPGVLLLSGRYGAGPGGCSSGGCTATRFG